MCFAIILLFSRYIERGDEDRDTGRSNRASLEGDTRTDAIYGNPLNDCTRLSLVIDEKSVIITGGDLLLISAELVINQNGFCTRKREERYL